MSVDVLAIGAHPDDVEMTIGGTVARLVEQGRTVAIVDMTAGEMGSRGTSEERLKESQAAAQVLGVKTRINLHLPDGRLQADLEGRDKLIEVIRKLRPALVLAPYWEDLHPDHAATSQMVCQTMYPSGFPKYPVTGEAWRPKEYLFYLSHFTFPPSLIVDISDAQHARKMQAIHCYHSQLHQDGPEQTPTWIGTPGFTDRLAARAVHYGSLIRRPYGEPLVSRRPVPASDLIQMYEPFFEV